MAPKKAQVGVVGLGVMGKNISLNLADHGYHTAVYNRTPHVTDEFLDYCRQYEPAWQFVTGFHDLESFIQGIEKPRRILLLIKAGQPTDLTIESLLAFLDPGDVIVDCGNAYWLDTIRRERELRQRNIDFIGSGVSGGETGARFGPSLMAGGTLEAWQKIESIWMSIAAKVDPVTGEPIEGAEPGKPITWGEPCAARVGENGAGHYVKMVHNGIEYIDMQLIAECYWLLKHLLKLPENEIGQLFASWNQGELASYLIEITADILQQPDPHGEGFLVEKILDVAGQKGTGKWTAISALDLGVPANSLAEAVFARYMSGLKQERLQANKIFPDTHTELPSNKSIFQEQIKTTLYNAKICAYAQGFQLLRQAQEAFGWHFDFATLAKIWRGGCIIRARFLKKIASAYEADPELANLLLDPYFSAVIQSGHTAWRQVTASAVLNGQPIPALSSALAYFDGYRSATLPANLIQAQRDYFGAHTYERIDQSRGRHYHLDWSGDRQERQVVE